MIIQLVTISVKPDDRAAFLRALRINYDGTAGEPGNLRYDVLRDPQDEGSFTIYEVFRDQAALDAHRASDHYLECMRIIGPMIAGAVSKKVLAPVFVPPPPGGASA